MLIVPLLSAVALMLLLTLVFYEINVHALDGGQLVVTLWLAGGVPLLAIVLSLAAASMQPPALYGPLAALIALGNGMLGLALHLLTRRHENRWGR